MKKHGADSPEPAALLLSPEAPYPLAGGGALRTASLIEYLAARYALDVIVFREPGAPDPRFAFPTGLARNVDVIDLPVHSKTTAARAVRNLRRFAAGRPPLNDRFRGFDREVEAAFGQHRYDVAVIEHFWCAPYVDLLAPRATRVVLDLHNLESALYGSLANAEPWPAALAMSRFAAAARRLEDRWLPRFSTVLTASAEDAARIPHAKAHVYPNAIPEAPPPEVPEENLVIFSGNLEYRPNVSAVRFFRTRIWPLLRAEWPDLKWRLVGKNPHAVEPYLRGDDRIELTGPVEDAIEALAAARVVVVPLLAGSGTRFKILEAWAARRAVVSTTLGAEGLQARDGEHLLLRDSPEAFAGAVSHLLATSGDRQRLGSAGRALCDSHFTWPHAWDALTSSSI